MAKQKKNKYSDIQPVPCEAIAAVGCEEDFVELLQPTHPAIPASNLLQKLSFSHFAELIAISDETTRTFYEIECIRGNWSVRELKRQINSLYYERSGLSKDKKKPAALAQEGAESADPKLAIRDSYVFEFLGLKPREVMSESHLEDQLVDKRQDFLLELGHGFCFEARQKRILIGDTDTENGTMKPLMGSTMVIWPQSCTCGKGMIVCVGRRDSAAKHVSFITQNRFELKWVKNRPGVFFKGRLGLMCQE